MGVLSASFKPGTSTLSFYTITPSPLLALQGNVKVGPTRDAQYTGYLRKWVRWNHVCVAFKSAMLWSWRVTLESGLPFRAGCEWIIDAWNSNSAEAEKGPLPAGRAESTFLSNSVWSVVSSGKPSPALWTMCLPSVLASFPAHYLQHIQHHVGHI